MKIILGIFRSETTSPRIREDYLTQTSEEIEGRVTKNVSQEFIWIENCILGVLARLDVFFQNPQSRARSEPVPETSRNLSGENQGTNKDDFGNKQQKMETGCKTFIFLNRSFNENRQV